MCNPENAELIENRAKVLCRIGVHPGAIWAFRKVHYLVFEEDFMQYTLRELEEWNNEWNALHPEDQLPVPFWLTRDIDNK